MMELQPSDSIGRPNHPICQVWVFLLGSNEEPHLRRYSYRFYGRPYCPDTQTEELKVLVLINCLGSQQYQLLSSLTAPDIPSTKTFQELLLLLKKHLSPKPNVLTEQHNFFSRHQHQGESISTFVSSLKDLTKNAEFKSECNSNNCSKSMLNLLLRSQFIRGLADADIREKLLQQGDATFDKTIEITLAIEAAKIENKEVYKSNYPNFINKISSGYIKKKFNSNFRNSENESKHQNRSRSKSPMKNKSSINLKELGLEGLYLHCGKTNHKTQDCFLKNKLRC
nr:uncharacterized protein LOC122270787 [Parasteatoda tepidariorum]